MSSAALPLPAAKPAESGWPLVLICWAALSLAWSIPNLTALAAYTGSTDDTMRLVQVRALLDGAGWYGLHEARLDPPHGLDSHWSRFVDAPIAALILIGRLFLSQQGAELFAMIAWPALVQLVMLTGFVLIGRRLAPEAGPIPMLAAFIACLPVMGYFRPLNIDHHNVQMALAVLLIAAAVWSRDRMAAAILGGVCGALVPAIGFESLHVLAAIELLVLGLAVFGGEKERRAAMFWFLAQGLALVHIYLLNTPPGWWLRSGCDALALNMLVMMGGGSLAVAAILWVARLMRPTVLAPLVIAVGVAALAVGLAMHPACLAGPNAAVDPQAITLWMRFVEEAEPWLSKLRSNPSQAAMFMVYPALAALAGVILALRRQLDAPLAVLLAVTLAAALVMFSQVRGFTYAAVTGALVIAVAGCRLFPGQGIAAVKRILAAAGLPVIASLATVLLPGPPQLAAANATQTAAEDQPIRTLDEICAARAAFAPLAAEPKGLVLSHIDLGPAILLNTAHSVVMAPYHRADQGIVAGFTLFALPAEEARAALSKAGVAYVADCTALPDAIDRSRIAKPFRDAAIGKLTLDWLKPLPADPAHPEMRFYKVMP